MALPPKPRRRRPTSRHHHHLLLLKASPLVLLLLLLPLLALRTSTLLLPRANSFGRRCLSEFQLAAPARQSIAIVSFSDDGVVGEDEGQRSFRGLMSIVSRNKEDYARRWGYRYVDAGDRIDLRRPPSWSKIPAVRAQLDGHDWVFWNDADSIVTNPNISLERILQAALGQSDLSNSPDLVVTTDFNGVNAGMWFIKRSEWSKAFLDTWWNQSEFVQFGSTKSGDNAALIHLITSMSPIERQRHVRMAPWQCMFNSYPWIPTWRNGYRLITSPSSIWRGVYSNGDFMVHLAGIDHKMEWTLKILMDLKESNPPIYNPSIELDQR